MTSSGAKVPDNITKVFSDVDNIASNIKTM